MGDCADQYWVRGLESPISGGGRGLDGAQVGRGDASGVAGGATCGGLSG